jgi:flagellar biosynthesis protein
MEKKFHEAVALKYTNGEDYAPKVIAKGKGELAEKIIEIAMSSGIPIREDKNLVKVLSTLDLYQEIPEELYRAVAAILAFIYSLNKKIQ